MDTDELKRMLNEANKSGNHPMNSTCAFMFGRMLENKRNNEETTNQNAQDIRGIHTKIDLNNQETNKKFDKLDKKVNSIGRLMWGILILLLAATLALAGNFAQLAQKASMEAKLVNPHVLETTKTLPR